LKYGDGKILDGLSTDGLLDAYSNSAMGVCAEKTVKDFQISRQ
jgi:acetyl-CoA C-acetyltransferase